MLEGRWSPWRLLPSLLPLALVSHLFHDVRQLARQSGNGPCTGHPQRTREGRLFASLTCRYRGEIRRGIVGAMQDSRGPWSGAVKVVPIRKRLHASGLGSPPNEDKKSHQQIIWVLTRLVSNAAGMHRIRADPIVAAVRYQVLIEREYDVRPQMRRRLQKMVEQV
jgi:hypothetical protein